MIREGLAAPVVLHQHRGPDALGDVLLAAEHVGDALPEELAHRVVVVACALPAENAQRHPVEPAGRLDIALLERGASALLYVALRRNGLVLASGHPPLGEADEPAELLVYRVYHDSAPFCVVSDTIVRPVYTPKRKRLQFNNLMSYCTSV